MRPVVRTVTANGADNWVPLDIYTTGGPLVQVDVNCAGGNVTNAQVDYTNDDPFNVTNPVVSGQLMASGAVTAGTPVHNSTTVVPRAVRLNVTNIGTATSVTMKVTQQGIR